MFATTSTAMLCLLVVCSAAMAQDSASWWNPKWRFRTTVTCPAPHRDAAARPVEVAVDFARLMERAGVRGQFDPASVRVVERGMEAPSAWRAELDAETGRERSYLAWISQPQIGQVGAADIYFDTKDSRIETPRYEASRLPPENLVTNPSFEQEADGLPVGWKVDTAPLVRLGRFKHTTGQRSLKVIVDETTPADARREVSLSQTMDVRRFTGQEMVFECDLLAERAAYGAPACIELQQFREDGSRILEYAVEPRWLTIELAQGQLVQFRERGRFSPDAATVTLSIRFRCLVRDADTGNVVGGPESFFTVWLDRVVVRPGERWPWPSASHGGFVDGALESAPLNRAFEFTGQRRLAFNPECEGTLTAGKFNPNPKSAHWGLQAGTLEFWCRPKWNADDGQERVFFDGVSYMPRVQSRLRKLDAQGRNELEFSIAPSDAKLRTIRGPATLRAGQWHHIAATWDFPKAQLQLFVDGKRIAAQGPGPEPWPFSLAAQGDKSLVGIGVTQDDKRSLPMQAFIGGDTTCATTRSAEAALDEFRVSDVVRYTADFTPQRSEFPVDGHTRALFHFENERHGVHDSDDRFVRGHLACELPRQEANAALDILDKGKIERRTVLVQPHPSPELLQANRVENRLAVTRSVRQPPDPRFVEYRAIQIVRTVATGDERFMLEVGGDHEPVMCSVTYQLAEPKTTRILHWHANDNVVPLSVESLAATLAPNAANDVERAFEAFKYALQVTNYFDAPYCETLPTRHRSRVSYTLLKAINIYPFDQCGPLNHTLRKLFLAVGISSNNAAGTHHQFEQAFYAGSWRLFDLSPRLYWLNRDNATVAGRRDFEDDPYLKLRQGSEVNSALPAMMSSATFGTAERPHRMDFPLRPGERVSLCWHNEGRWFEVTGEKRETVALAKIPPCFGNGAIVYEPVAVGLTGQIAELNNSAIRSPSNAEAAATALDNMVVEGSVLRPRDPAKPAALVYRLSCPYILSDAQVSGAYAAQEPGAIRLSLSFDDFKTSTEVWRGPGKAGDLAASLRDQVSGRYAYALKLEFDAGKSAGVTGLKVRTTFVASPLALPGKLKRGENRITFVGGQPSAPVATTCRWIERHRSELGVSLNALSYYMNGDEAHRNLFIVAPGRELPVQVTLMGRPLRGQAQLEGLPKGWACEPAKRPIEFADAAKPAVAEFLVRPGQAEEGGIRAFEVVVRERGQERRVCAQALVARAALVREAEQADETAGDVAPVELGELSGARGMAFRGDGRLAFDFTTSTEGKYALWLRARWEPGSSARMVLALDQEKPRDLRVTAMIGFSDWTDAKQANTKMFAYFGEQYGHWSWYRIPDVALTPGKHRLTLSAAKGACFDALTLLPQTPAMDRAAMNLFQNWNYAPWLNPL